MEKIKDTEISTFVKLFTGVELKQNEVSDTSKSVVKITEKITKEMAKLSFDVEPSNFSALLNDMAPNHLKNKNAE